jgi:hypothetical protein
MLAFKHLPVATRLKVSISLWVLGIDDFSVIIDV